MHKEFQGGGLRVPKILYAFIVCVFDLLLKKTQELFQFARFAAPPEAAKMRRSHPWGEPSLSAEIWRRPP